MVAVVVAEMMAVEVEDVLLLVFESSSSAPQALQTCLQTDRPAINHVSDLISSHP